MILTDVFLPKRLKITHTKHISGQLAGQVAERQTPGRDRDPEERLLLFHCSGDSTEAVCFITISSVPDDYPEKERMDTYESTDDLQSDKRWRRLGVDGPQHMLCFHGSL